MLPVVKVYHTWVRVVQCKVFQTILLCALASMCTLIPVFVCVCVWNMELQISESL